MTLNFPHITFTAFAGGLVSQGVNNRSTQEGVCVGLTSATIYSVSIQAAAHFHVNPPIIATILACALAILGTIKLLNQLEGKAWKYKEMVGFQLQTAIVGSLACYLMTGRI